jgi:O-succinylbenzoic acid--CoA ligase
MLSLDAFLLKTQELSSTAIQSTSSELTYDQLRKDVLKTVSTLMQKEIKEEDNVAIIGNNDSEFIKLVLALWQIKVVPVLINPKLTVNEIEEQINTTDCNTAFVSKNADPILNNLDINIIEYPLKKKKEKSNPELTDSLDPAATAIIIFTAGTTGKAKGVELSFNSLKQSAKNGDQIINHTNNDKWLASLPFFHIGGFSIITRALLHNAAICIPKSLDTSALTDGFKKFKPNYCSLVPTQLKRLLEAGVKPNKELKNVLLGGGVIDQRIISNAIEADWHVTIVYGSTETASFITALTEDEIHYKTGSVGKAVNSNKIAIVNENGHQLDIGEVGFVTISSTSLMKGYYNKPEETGTKLENGFYYSDDVGYLDDEGYLFLEARKDDMIVTGGENVYPFEVENRIIEHPDISDVGVFPVKDDEWGEIVSAAIVLNDSRSEMDLDELTDFLEESLAPYKIPKKLFVVEKLPRNELGKLSRGILADMYSGE